MDKNNIKMAVVFCSTAIAIVSIIAMAWGSIGLKTLGTILFGTACLFVLGMTGKVD